MWKDEGRVAKQRLSRYRGGNQRKEPEPQQTEKGGDKAKKGKKAKTKTWSDVVKGLKTEDGLEVAISDKSGNRSEIADSVEHFFDLDKPYHLKAKRNRS